MQGSVCQWTHVTRGRSSRHLSILDRRRSLISRPVPHLYQRQKPHTLWRNHVRHGDPLQVVLLQPGAHAHGGPLPGDAGQLQLPAAGGGGAAEGAQARWVERDERSLSR